MENKLQAAAIWNLCLFTLFVAVFTNITGKSEKHIMSGKEHWGPAGQS